MKKLLVCYLFLLSVNSWGQSPVSSRILSGIDLGASFQKGTFSPSITYYELLNIGKQKTFSVGWTFTTAYVAGSNVSYITAPAKLTRGKTGFEALSASIIERNIDTINLEKATQTIFNFGLRAQLKLGPIELGGSADLLGFVLGRTRLGQVVSSKGGYYGTNKAGRDSLIYFRGDQQWQYAKAKGVTIRLLGDNDRGSLATEAYARLMINRRIGIKVAYQWLTTETQLKLTKTVDGNLRYRRRVEMPYVAVTFPFFK